MKYLLLLLHIAVRHTLGKFCLSSPLFYFIVRARSGSVSLCTWAHSPRSKTAKTQAKNTHSLGLGWTPLFLVSLLFSLLLLLLLFFSFFFFYYNMYNTSSRENPRESNRKEQFRSHGVFAPFQGSSSSCYTRILPSQRQSVNNIVANCILGIGKS